MASPKPCKKCETITELVGQNGHDPDYRECLNCKKDRERAYDRHVDPAGVYSNPGRYTEDSLD